MTPEAQKLLEEVRKLSDDDQEELVNELRSLDEPGDLESEKAWLAVTRRRIAEVDSGKVIPIPWDEAIRRLRNAGNR